MMQRVSFLRWTRFTRWVLGFGVSIYGVDSSNFSFFARCWCGCVACAALSVLVVWICGRITPHDINRIVQFTLYTRHFKGNLSEHMDMDSNSASTGDGLVNFTEFESFMEAMLVLFGDDTSPPDLDKM
jgi:hypothetical protein